MEDLLGDILAWDAAAQEKAETTPPLPAKKGGRKVIPALYVDSSRRLVIFCKRKGGLQSKASQLTGRTGSNVLLLIQQVPSDDSMNNYAYADPTWRTSLFSDAMRMLLSEPHGLRDSSSSTVYAPTEEYVNPFLHVPESAIENIAIYDTDDKTGVRRSDSQDSYCKITFGPKIRRSRSRTDDTPGASSGFWFCDEEPAPEEEAEAEGEDAFDEAERELEKLLGSIAMQVGETPDQGAENRQPKKKRGAVSVGYIKDTRKRGQTHTKRIEGIMNKAFELTALSGCHCLLVASSPSSAPPGIREGTPIPSTYHVFASPAWRRSPALVELMRVLRLAQETDYWAPRFFASQRKSEVPPIDRFLVSLGYADELDGAIERSKQQAGYMFPPQAGSVKMQTIKNSEDCGVSFTWRTSILPLSEAHLISRKRRGEARRSRPQKISIKQARHEEEGYYNEEVGVEGSPVPRVPLCVSLDCVNKSASAAFEAYPRIQPCISEPISQQHEDDVASACGSVPRGLSSASDFEMVDGDSGYPREALRPTFKPPALADMATIKTILGARKLKRSARGLDLFL